MAKNQEKLQAPEKPSTPVPESEVVSMGDVTLPDDPDAATAQIAQAMTGQDADAGPLQPTISKVTIGDQEFELDSGAASAIEAQQDGFQKQYDELRGLLPKRPAPKSTPDPEPVKGPDWGNMIFDDPQRFVNEFGEHIRKTTIDEMKGQYSADQQMRDFWTEFYRENDDLREFDWVVRASLGRHSSELMDLPIARAVTKLGELSRGDIVGLAGKFAKAEEKPSRATVESGRPSHAPAPAPDIGSGEQAEAGNVQSISGVLRARKAARRKAAL